MPFSSEKNASGQKPIIQPRFTLAYGYPVHFTAGVFGPGNSLLSEILLPPGSEVVPRILLLLDGTLDTALPELKDRMARYFHRLNLDLAGDPMVLPGGEQCKNDLSVLHSIYDAVADRGIDRHSYIIVVGGGALIDVAGFAAATAHRGIRLIRIPTTVLAQNDASVGVKNGLNFAGRKNFIGSFAPPNAVINDLELLETLEERDRRAGLAEAIKVALIRDQQFFEWMEANAEALNRFVLGGAPGPEVQYVIYRCAELHLKQISNGGDPFETGSARPLDFGHWSAHFLEEISQHSIRHGEAVCMGMVLDSLYSQSVGLLSGDQRDRILGLVQKLDFPIASDLWKKLDVKSALESFREHLGGELCITLLKAVGKGVEVHEIDNAMMQKLAESLTSGIPV
jgi:3-dehydroquinate synthase